MAQTRAIWLRKGWPTVVRWRSLSWEEYRKLRNLNIPEGARHMEVYRTCLVDGPHPEIVSAGIATWVGKKEFDESPFSGVYSSIRQTLDRKRADVPASWLKMAKAIVAWAFRYSFEEIDRWDSETFFERVAQAEFILGRPLDPVDPTAPPPPDPKQGDPRRRRRPGPPAPPPRGSGPEVEQEQYAFRR